MRVRPRVIHSKPQLREIGGGRAHVKCRGAHGLGAYWEAYEVWGTTSRGPEKNPLESGWREETLWDSLPGWRPPQFPPPALPPGGEGHWRMEGAGQCPEGASGDHSGHGCPEPWEQLAGFHEVLAGGGGGGGHTSEGNQGPAKPEVPQDPDPGAHLSPSWQLSPKPASSPASDSCLGPCHGPILGQAAGPWANPCSCGSPGPSLCTRHSPASTGSRPGLEKDRTLAPEW